MSIGTAAHPHEANWASGSSWGFGVLASDLLGVCHEDGSEMGLTEMEGGAKISLVETLSWGGSMKQLQVERVVAVCAVRLEEHSRLGEQARDEHMNKERAELQDGEGFVGTRCCLLSFGLCRALSLLLLAENTTRMFRTLHIVSKASLGL